MGGPERLHVRGESVLGQVPQGREDGAEPGRRDDRIAPLDRVPVAEGRPQETETEEVPVEGRGTPRTEMNPAEHKPRVRRENWCRVSCGYGSSTPRVGRRASTARHRI